MELRRAIPKVERDEPNREKVRTDRADPIWMKSSKDMELPIRAQPKRLHEDPHLPKERTENVLPR
jgi:hypothetical protein